MCKIIGTGRVYREGQTVFYKEMGGEARTFFSKKRGQVVSSSSKKGDSHFIQRKKGEVFFTDLKMGDQYIFATNRGASDLFCHFSSHNVPNRGQCIEISEIEEIGASAFLIG